MQALSSISFRLGLLASISVLFVVALIVHGPISQPVDYHSFADQRILLGIPNFWNVATNAPFLAIGAYGLWLLMRGYCAGTFADLRPAYAVFFLGVTLVAAGSGFYHLAPSNNTLVWDRLPMTLAFSALFVAIVAERIDVRSVRIALTPMLILGVASVYWWQYSGDLRPYVLVQFLPVILIPLILILYPSELPGARGLWGVIAAYLIAKVFEALDARTYELIGVGGHAFKHIAAGVGVWCVARILSARGNTVATSDKIGSSGVVA